MALNYLNVGILDVKSINGFPVGIPTLWSFKPSPQTILATLNSIITFSPPNVLGLNGWDNTTNAQFIAPATGVYRFDISFSIDIANISDSIQFKVNDVVPPSNPTFGSLLNTAWQTFACSLALNAGDKFYVVYNNLDAVNSATVVSGIINISKIQ